MSVYEVEVVGLLALGLPLCKVLEINQRRLYE